MQMHISIVDAAMTGIITAIFC